MTRILDGKALAAAVLDECRAETAALTAKGVVPGLAVVLVGEDPASQVYVKSSKAAISWPGFHSVQHDLAATTTEAELLALVRELNADPAIHGILVQSAAAADLDSSKVLIETIAPAKDVDGFHPVNVGSARDRPLQRALVPCTPAGGMVLIEDAAERSGSQFRRGGRRRRPLAHRRQADGASCSAAETTPPSPSPIRARGTCPHLRAAPIFSSPPSVGRRNDPRATGSSPAPS